MSDSPFPRRADLFPLLVPRVYLDLPDARGEEPVLRKCGIVRQIGPGVYRMLINASDKLIRNVHLEHLDRLGLSVEEAEFVALGNLREIVRGGRDIQIRETTAANGRKHCVWMGHWLTASSALLPEMFDWATLRLQCDQILVSVPDRQFLFLFPAGDIAFRNVMRSYICKVVDGMNHLITFDLVVLSAQGLRPYVEEPAEAAP